MCRRTVGPESIGRRHGQKTAGADKSDPRYFGSGVLIDPAETSHAGGQHTTVALNLAGFHPGEFFNNLVYRAVPIAANIGFTFQFQADYDSIRSPSELIG